MSIPTLSLDSISFSYPAYPGLPERLLFDNLSLSVQPGEFSLILGAPDAGKTTLSRLIMGLLPRYSGGEKQGHILIEGIEVDHWDHRELLSRAGLLFQDPEEQILMTRCDGETAFTMESLGVPPTAMRLRVTEALKWMDLNGFEGRDPASLSGGEQKRVLLAAVRAQDPLLWILDETLEELDRVTRKNILDTLIAEGKTVLLFASKYISLFDDYNPTTYLLKDSQLNLIESDDREERLSQEGLGFQSVITDSLKPSETNPQSPNGTKPFLKVENLSFTYGVDQFSLDIPDLSINTGERVALLGQNGSGKSTLARILCGLIKPHGGTVSIFEESGIFQSLDENKRKQTVSYLFQNPDYQLFLPTLEEELVYGMDSKTAQPRAEEAMERFHLPFREAPPALLSYGVRKRLQGAIAYMQPRKLLILDEGDSGLTYKEFFSLHGQLHREGAALLLITHHRDLAEALSDRIITMDAGRIVNEEWL